MVDTIAAIVKTNIVKLMRQLQSVNYSSVTSSIIVITLLELLITLLH